MKTKILQAALGGLWICLGLSFLVAWWFSDVPAAAVPGKLAAWVDGVGLGVAIGLFWLLYTVRPLILFPSSIMGLASGLTFGPLLGCGVAFVGELLGACLAFLAARLVLRPWLKLGKWPLLQRLDQHLEQNGLLTVCVARLVWLPFDTISYVCGVSRIHLKHFLGGTLLGATPYLLSITLLGGSAAAALDGSLTIGEWQLSHRLLVFALGVVSFGLGVGLAVILRRRFRREMQAKALAV